ncbi:HAD family phosphatase [Pseudonocardiaceae bacterium YIM PH 21723]|nr:HAD family phosphatase [Pseudonocardiaceae bacterium YIM PH 21723]
MTLGNLRPPRAVVFDCDGLLMDTEPCWTIAETELFARYGLPFGPEQKALVIGKSVEQAGQVIASLTGASAAEATDDLVRAVTEIVAAKAEPLPGAVELVARVSALVPVAVASNSVRSMLDVALGRGGFSFEVSVAADEVASPKPAPDLYLEACRRLGVSPASALAFEDSPTGGRSAQAAGVPLIAVPTLHAFPADVVLGSLTDPELLDWVATWPATS